eukprot:362295-Chlamydomonas_euryale.AAC.7
MAGAGARGRGQSGRLRAWPEAGYHFGVRGSPTGFNDLQQACVDKPASRRDAATGAVLRPKSTRTRHVKEGRAESGAYNARRYWGCTLLSGDALHHHASAELPQASSTRHPRQHRGHKTTLRNTGSAHLKCRARHSRKLGRQLHELHAAAASAAAGAGAAASPVHSPADLRNERTPPAAAASIRPRRRRRCRREHAHAHAATPRERSWLTRARALARTGHAVVPTARGREPFAESRAGAQKTEASNSAKAMRSPRRREAR